MKAVLGEGIIVTDAPDTLDSRFFLMQDRITLAYRQMRGGA